MRVEGMTMTEAITSIKDWPSAPAAVPQNGNDDAEKLAFIKSIWTSAQPLLGSMAEHYLDETRHIDVTKLPDDIHRSSALPSELRIWSGHLPAVPDRFDAGSAHR